jgi:hypothetical protein
MMIFHKAVKIFKFTRCRGANTACQLKFEMLKQRGFVMRTLGKFRNNALNANSLHWYLKQEKKTAISYKIHSRRTKPTPQLI